MPLLTHVDPLPIYKATNKATKPIVLQEDLIGILSTCEADTVRLLAFTVLVASPSPLRPFTPKALDIMKSQMGILYADTDAKFRTDTLSNTRKLIERLRGTTSYLNRELANLAHKFHSQPSTVSAEEQIVCIQMREVLKLHEEFIEWFFEFLTYELTPTASYQRHITSLKAIRLLLQSGIIEQSSRSPLSTSSDNAASWPYRVHLFATRAMRFLLDLLMDPFEDVRSIAAALLKCAPVECFIDVGNREVEYAKPTLSQPSKSSQLTERNTEQEENSLSSLTAFMSRAEDLAKRTGRADYGNGIARCYELLYTLLPTQLRLNLVKRLAQDLDVKVKIAEQDLGRAVLDAPVHGTFAALK